MALTAVPGMTVCEIPALLTDDAFRRRVLSKVNDPFGIESFWATFEQWKPAERLQIIAPTLNKTRALTMRPRLRTVFGQSTPAVDFNQIIAEQKILLVNLAAGTIGSEASYLLGALLFAGLWDAVTARAGSEHRPTVMCHVDELRHLVTLPTPLETILSEARSYGLGLTLALQDTSQLESSVRHAVMANARSKVIFQASHHDAALLARELGGAFTADDLLGIPAFEAVVSAHAAGAVQPPATIRTMPLPSALRSAAEVRDNSRSSYGRTRAEVEAELASRQFGGTHTQRPVGRTKRGSS